MVDGLTTKVKAWEKERGVPFLCDKVTNRTFTQLSFLWFDSAYVSYDFFDPAPVVTNTGRRNCFACSKRGGKASVPSTCVSQNKDL